MLQSLASLGLSISDLIQIAIQALGFVGVIWGLRQNHRALQTNVALDFSRRYDEITRDLPEHLRAQSPEATFADLNDADRYRFMNYSRRYLNLCSEEYALYLKGRIASDIWAIWHSEIAATLDRKIWQDTWRQLRDEFNSSPEFRKFVDGRCS